MAKVRAAEYHEAIMDFEKIIELEPDNSNGYSYLAKASIKSVSYG